MKRRIRKTSCSRFPVLTVLFWVFSAGCATFQQEYDKAVREEFSTRLDDPNAQADLEYLRKQPVCQRLGFFYAYGEYTSSARSGPKATLDQQEVMIWIVVERITPDEFERTAMHEMYWLGHRRQSIDAAQCKQSLECLQKERQQMESGRVNLIKGLPSQSHKR